MRSANKKIYCLISALAFCPALMADVVIPESKTIFVEPGDLLEHVIDIDRRRDIRQEVRLLAPPDGAYIEVSDEGQMKVRWETGLSLPEQSQISIQVRNVDTHELVETVELQVRSGPIPIVGNPLDEEVIVSLDPMANQIVSTGRMVSVAIKATSTDDKDPLISIDRVPRDASFDKNPLGGYTFFWRTNDQNQGEHVFRITARHPEDSNFSATSLLTVYIGDPSRSKTLPVGTSE